MSSIYHHVPSDSISDSNVWHVCLNNIIKKHLWCIPTLICNSPLVLPDINLCVIESFIPKRCVQSTFNLVACKVKLWLCTVSIGTQVINVEQATRCYRQYDHCSDFHTSCTLNRFGKLLQNVGNCLQIYTASYFTTLKSSSIPLWEPQFSYNKANIPRTTSVKEHL